MGYLTTSPSPIANHGLCQPKLTIPGSDARSMPSQKTKISRKVKKSASGMLGMRSTLDLPRRQRSTNQLKAPNPTELNSNLQQRPVENHFLPSISKPHHCTYRYHQSHRTMPYKAFAPNIFLRSSSHTTHPFMALLYPIQIRDYPQTLKQKSRNQLTHERSTNTLLALSGSLQILSFSSHRGIA